MAGRLTEPAPSCRPMPRPSQDPGQDTWRLSSTVSALWLEPVPPREQPVPVHHTDYQWEVSAAWTSYLAARFSRLSAGEFTRCNYGISTEKPYRVHPLRLISARQHRRRSFRSAGRLRLSQTTESPRSRGAVWWTGRVETAASSVEQQPGWKVSVGAWPRKRSRSS